VKKKNLEAKKMKKKKKKKKKKDLMKDLKMNRRLKANNLHKKFNLKLNH
jgi:hypothetical protein